MNITTTGDDDRYPFAPGQVAQMRSVRFRTLGCWPLTAAQESDATTLDQVINPMGGPLE